MSSGPCVNYPHGEVVDINPADLFGSEADRRSDELKSDLVNFLKCVQGNAALFLALCEYGAADGHNLDPECCSPIADHTMQRILRDGLRIMISNKPVNGKPGNWNCGFLGSRWLDMNAREYGLDYIRCAFYSKKCGGGEWPHSKPYAIMITAEKASD